MPPPAGVQPRANFVAPGAKLRIANKSRKKQNQGQGQGAQVLQAPPPLAAPAVTPTAGVVVADGPTKAKSQKVWCSKCKNGKHTTKECSVVHYCYICDKFNHPMSKCLVLKQP